MDELQTKIVFTFLDENRSTVQEQIHGPEALILTPSFHFCAGCLVNKLAFPSFGSVLRDCLTPNTTE